MDRHELDLLTRDELLGLARAAGIDGVEWLSREELVTLLARSSSPGRSRGIFDRARALLDRARELGKTLRPSHPPDPPPAPPTPPTPPTPLASASDDPPPATPPGPAGRFETLTMAEVYASQGHVREARRIAQAVLAREPDNADAKGLLERLPEPSAADEGADAPAPPRSHDEDVVGLVLVGPSVLHATWVVTASGRARARGLLGEDGRLVLRISTATVAGLTTRDAEVVPVGDHTVQGAAPDARHRAAVGLVGQGGRFVSIEHSAPVTTPPAGASPGTGVERVEVPGPPPSPDVRRPAPGVS